MTDRQTDTTENVFTAFILNPQARERAGLLGDKVEEIAQPSERTGELPLCF